MPPTATTRRHSTHADVLGRGPFRGHPLTGPVRVRGAAARRHAGGRGARDGAGAPTSAGRRSARGAACSPRRISPSRYLQIWDVSDGTSTRAWATASRCRSAAFPGVMGTALDEAGGHSTMPPRKNGGNMDIKQLTVGSTLYLPVWVDGALFSVGRRPRRAGRRRGVRHRGRDGGAGDAPLRPSARAADSGAAAAHAAPIGRGEPTGPCFATTAHGPDLFASAQQAIRYMIDHLVEERGLSREQAYIVARAWPSISRSARSSTRPNWIVSAFLPESIFT